MPANMLSSLQCQTHTVTDTKTTKARPYKNMHMTRAKTNAKQSIQRYIQWNKKRRSANRNGTDLAIFEGFQMVLSSTGRES